MSDDEYYIPNDDTVSAGDIRSEADLHQRNLSEADLSRADLSKANLIGANLSGVNLGGADLSMANLSEADLSNANLRGADLSEANLHGADLWRADLRRSGLLKANLRGSFLTRADLRGADLSDANLFGAELPKSNLHEADLSGANLINTTLTDAVLWDTSLSDTLFSRGTTVGPLGQRLEQYAENEVDTVHSSDSVELYDVIARANHELRSAYSANGLTSQARKARIRERRARRREAKADGTFRGTWDWAGSLLSRVVTGYGVQLLPVGLVMLVLFLGSAAIYQVTGMGVQESLYYSVVTFTTSPPSDPQPGLMRLVAGIETFLGTTTIIFLGYVLGTREQV